jgi:hypothetical protein
MLQHTPPVDVRQDMSASRSLVGIVSGSVVAGELVLVFTSTVNCIVIRVAICIAYDYTITVLLIATRMTMQLL